MYIERIVIKNIGPFENLDIKLDGGSVAFVGVNASGKTLLLSSIVDFIHEHLREIGFHDVMRGSGSSDGGYAYFRITSTSFLKDASQPGFIWIAGKVDEHDLFYLEEYGYENKEELLKQLQEPESNVPWPSNNESKAIKSLEREEKILAQKNLTTIPILFLPSTRFENESWKTEKYFDADFSVKAPFRGSLGHSVELYKSFHENYTWLTNALFNVAHFPTDTTLRDKLGMVNAMISKLLNKKASIRISPLFNDRLAVVDDRDNTLIHSFSHLSLGQMAIMNIVLNILRESKQNISNDSVQGMVIIDEIDAHLTGTYKADVLPSIIRAFPKIQFIVTTHDPLSVVGLERHSTIRLLELPSGSEIFARNFSEVSVARDKLRRQNNELHRIIKEVSMTNKPILIVEDSHPEIYKVAWLKLNKKEFDQNTVNQAFLRLAPFQIISANGHINLYTFLNADNLPDNILDKKLVGLFDFDEAFCSFNGLSNKDWGNIQGDDRTGLYRNHSKINGYHALMLPVPYYRRSLAGLAYGNNSRLAIELYFSNKCLGEHCAIDNGIPGRLVKFSGNKANFWKKCIDYDYSDFGQFRKLFAKIEDLLK